MRLLRGAGMVVGSAVWYMLAVAAFALAFAVIGALAWIASVVDQGFWPLTLAVVVAGFVGLAHIVSYVEDARR